VPIRHQDAGTDPVATPFAGVIPFAPDTEFLTDERCAIVELSTAPADPDLSVARARVAAGNVTRWHRLHGVTERYVILAGEGSVDVGDLPPRTVTHLDVVVIPPGTPQRIASTGADDLVFLCLCTPPFTAACYEDVDSEQVTGEVDW
jgi:mannose-6-phosphate isomerase-like protein (cupin superfamily)